MTHPLLKTDNLYDTPGIGSISSLKCTSSSLFCICWLDVTVRRTLPPAPSQQHLRHSAECGGRQLHPELTLPAKDVEQALSPNCVSKTWWIIPRWFGLHAFSLKATTGNFACFTLVDRNAARHCKCLKFYKVCNAGKTLLVETSWETEHCLGDSIEYLLPVLACLTTEFNLRK